MNNKIAFIALAALSSAVTSQAASINFDTGSARGHMFVTSTNVRLAVDSIVKLGTLTTPGVASSFVEFATTKINNTGGASTVFGFLRDGVSIATAPEADAIKGKQIYIYVFNTNVAANTGLDTVEKGLFTSAEWTLPAGFDSAGTTTFNIRLGGNSNATPATLGVEGQAVLGTYTAGTITIGSGATATNTAAGIYMLAPAVPEPSAMGLLVIAGLGIMRRRR